MRKIVKQSKSHKNRLEIDISSSWIEYLDIKMSVLPQLIYKINTIPIKMQKCFFSVRQIAIKVHMEKQTCKNHMKKMAKEKL